MKKLSLEKSSKAPYLLIYKFTFEFDLLYRFPVAEKGVLDLTEWDFQKDGAIKIDGEWELYWKQLLTYDDFHEKENIYKPSGYFNIPKVWNKYQIAIYR